MKQQKVQTHEIVARLRLQIDDQLDILNQATKEGDTDLIESTKHELQAIHDTLVTLGHWSSDGLLKQKVDAVF